MDSKSRGDADDNLNGFMLSSRFIPREVLAHIFSYLFIPDLVCNCRLVCSAWNQVISEDVRKLEMKRGNFKSFSNLSLHEKIHLKLPAGLFYLIFWKDPFEKNLLRNNCGQSKLKHWNVREPKYTHDSGFLIEEKPIGSDILPTSEEFGDNTSCFSTTFSVCDKEQEIDLRRHGTFGWVMDEFQPKIIISEWYAGRFDCGCVYRLVALLLDDKRSVLHRKEEFRCIRQWKGGKWEKVIIEFENYGPGVRYIVFKHLGNDTQYWDGNYGSKMAGGVVKISLPSIPDN